MRARHCRHAIVHAVLLTLLLTSNGCTTAGALAHKFVGPPPVPAAYKPAKEPMLVLVENYRNPAAAMLDSNRLAMLVSDELRRHDVAPVVSPSRLEAVRSDPNFSKMTIPAIGRAVKAKQVLYVNVRRYGVDGTVGGDMIKGAADMTVRVVDSATGENRWPIDNAGHPVAISTNWLRRGDGVDEASLREQMSRSAADSIGRLFRKYSAEERPADQSIQ